MYIFHVISGEIAPQVVLTRLRMAFLLKVFVVDLGVRFDEIYYLFGLLIGELVVRDFLLGFPCRLPPLWCPSS